MAPPAWAFRPIRPPRGRRTLSWMSRLLAFLLALPLAAGAQELDALASFEAPVSAAKSAAQAPAGVDLSFHFVDGPRKQGGLGSCHSFVAVALLELSEADLFVRRNALPAFPFLRSRETGMLRPDLRRAPDGVMPGDHYAAFEERYRAFKKRFFKFLDKRSSVVAELLPESATPEASAARARIREELRGFSAEGESFLKFAGAAARSAAAKGPVRCREARVAGFLERQLNAGRPVGVGLNTGWTASPAWRRGSDGPGGSHYFVVTGYERGAAGTVFRTRNTWSEEAGGSPDLSGRDLCEVFAMTWVRAPADER